MQEKVCLISLGCPKNLVDSEVMLGYLKKEGYRISPRKEDSEIIILNTCAFIEEATRESIDMILELSEFKKNGKCSLLVVSGCLPQRYGKELKKELPEVDLFIGTGEFHRIGKILKDIEGSLPPYPDIYLSDPTFILNDNTPRIISTPPYSAYVKIAEGCSNHCTYCIIPQLRGKFRSRTVESITSEVKKLVRAGVKEINLISQDTTKYGKDLGKNINLTLLLKSLVDIPGIEWIRILYCNPDHFSPGLIEIIKTEKICKYVDLPIQHISDSILKKMGRKGGSKEIRYIINELREKIPGVHLRTTIMVGFPGESKEDFTQLVNFIEEVRFEHLGVFQYSKEEGTSAFSMKGDVAGKIKEERYHVLMEIQSKISLEKNREKIGSTMPVIVEGFEKESCMVGRTSFQAPDIDGIIYLTKGYGEVGKIVQARITGAYEYDLIGEII